MGKGLDFYGIFGCLEDFFVVRLLWEFCLVWIYKYYKCNNNRLIIYQNAIRNMCEAEKIYANDKVSARRIEEENEKKIKEGYSKERRSEKSSCVQMDAGSNVQQRDRSTNTREQRAKIAGVSAGTVARFNKVMNSDDEELKKLWNGCLISS